MSLSATSLPDARPERIIKEVLSKTQYVSAQPFLSTRTVEPSQVASGIPSHLLIETMAPPVPPLEPPRTEIPPEPEGSITPPVPGFDVQEQPQRLCSSMSPPAIKEQPQRLYYAIASPAIETKLPLLSSVSSVAGYSGSVLPGSPLSSAVPALQAPIVPIASPQLSSVLPVAPVQTVPQGISSQPLMATLLAPASPQLSVVAPASPLQTISAVPPLKASPLASARQVSPGPIQMTSPRTSPRLRSPTARFRSSSPNVSRHMSPQVLSMTTSPRPSRMESSPWKYLPPPLPAPLPTVAMGSSVATQPPIPSSLNLSPRSPSLRMVDDVPGILEQNAPLVGEIMVAIADPNAIQEVAPRRKRLPREPPTLPGQGHVFGFDEHIQISVEECDDWQLSDDIIGNRVMEPADYAEECSQKLWATDRVASLIQVIDASWFDSEPIVSSKNLFSPAISGNVADDDQPRLRDASREGGLPEVQALLAEDDTSQINLACPDLAGACDKVTELSATTQAPTAAPGGIVLCKAAADTLLARRYADALRLADALRAQGYSEEQIQELMRAAIEEQQSAILKTLQKGWQIGDEAEVFTREKWCNAEIEKVWIENGETMVLAIVLVDDDCTTWQILAARDPSLRFVGRPEAQKAAREVQENDTIPEPQNHIDEARHNPCEHDTASRRERLRQWLMELAPSGALLGYLDALDTEFEGDFSQIVAAKIEVTGSGKSGPLEQIEPSFFDVIGVKHLGHRLLLAKGILALPSGDDSACQPSSATAFPCDVGSVQSASQPNGMALEAYSSEAIPGGLSEVEGTQVPSQKMRKSTKSTEQARAQTASARKASADARAKKKKPTRLSVSAWKAWRKAIRQKEKRERSLSSVNNKLYEKRKANKVMPDCKGITA